MSQSEKHKKRREKRAKQKIREARSQRNGLRRGKQKREGEEYQIPGFRPKTIEQAKGVLDKHKKPEEQGLKYLFKRIFVGKE